MSQIVQDDAEIMADMVVQTIKSAISPLIARIAVLEGAATVVEQKMAPFTDASLLARISALEAREAVAGPVGPRGETGPQGEAGPRGEAGEAGKDGAPGLNGKDGAAGVNGKDADLSLLMALKSDIATMQGEWAAFKSWQASTVSDVMAKMLPTAPVVDETAIVERVKSAVLSAIPAPKDGKDGASVDPKVVDVMVAAQVERAVAAIPKPQDGRSVTVDDVRPVIVTELEKAVAVLPRPQDGQPGAAGKDGADGRSVTVDDVRPLIVGELEKAVASLPKAKDGEPGKSVDLAEVKALVVQAVAEIPKPLDGKSLTVADVAPLIAEEARKAVEALPRPKDGKAGTDVVDLMINRDGVLVMTLSDGSTKSAGTVVGRDGRDADMSLLRKQVEEELAKWPRPQDGMPGKDGFGFDNFDVVFDPQHGYQLRFIRGEEHKDFPVPFPWDAGTYTHGRLYPKAAGVTDRGAYWIAQEPTTSRPPKLGEPRLSSCPWRLAVKPGRDGKDGKGGE